MLPDPALRGLLRLKVAAAVRKQLRRLRTWRGLLFALLGAALFLLWMASFAIGALGQGLRPAAPERAEVLVRLGAVLVTLMVLLGSLRHRGLYIPSEEIERLFSSPVHRHDITRYRCLAIAGRALLGGLALGGVLMWRLPRPAFALLGILCALATASVLGQTLSILAGALERRLVRWLDLPRTLLTVLVAAGGMAIVWALVLHSEGDAAGLGELVHARAGELTLLVERALTSPAWRVLTLPFEPWARAIAAPGAAEFVPWFALSVALFALLVELTARVPIDYRELSLETSASVAEKLRRLRRVGGGASAGGISRRTVKVRLPLVFGQGPAGAIAWRKAIEIVRKARSTLWISGFVMVVILLVSGLAFPGAAPGEEAGRAAIIAVLGTLYLCSGLRFDFRDDLDRMQSIKSWPVTARGVFAATLLPEVVLVSGLLVLAIALRAALSGGFHAGVLAVAVAIPPAVLGWLALDNAVFLLAPVRYVPGQEGALQNAGRMMLLLFLRVLVAGVVFGLAAGFGFLAHLVATGPLGLSAATGRGAGIVAGWLCLAAADAGLIEVGGRLFARFDVARDRG